MKHRQRLLLPSPLNYCWFQLNLASQSVLEGLNACLDHRGEVFVPELNRTFTVGHSRFFGCQNPYRQGGARRGLPRSFLNRFVQLSLEPLSRGDLQTLVRYLHPALPEVTRNNMVLFNEKVSVLLRARFEKHDIHYWNDTNMITSA